MTALVVLVLMALIGHIDDVGPIIPMALMALIVLIALIVVLIAFSPSVSMTLIALYAFPRPACVRASRLSYQVSLCRG